MFNQSDVKSTVGLEENGKYQLVHLFFGGREFCYQILCEGFAIVTCRETDVAYRQYWDVLAKHEASVARIALRNNND